MGEPRAWWAVGSGLPEASARPRLRANHWRLLAAGIACAALLGSVLLPPTPRLLWNASASSPIGLYLVQPAAPLRPGDMAIAWPPPAARRLAALRRYLPAGVPLVKPVAAVAGDRVCGAGRKLLINGATAALGHVLDPSGRPMPHWSGCRVLRRGELLLLSSDVPDAFDGRYFGTTAEQDVVGRARLLWAR